MGKPINENKTNGDASEAGVLKVSKKITSVADMRAINPQAADISFNSAT